MKARRELILILVLVGFLAAYFGCPPFERVVDKGVDPAVFGLTLLYSKASTWLNRSAGFDLGFVQPQVDSEFDFSVQLARWVNERNAGPIMDIVTDSRRPAENRERALKSFLKFESVNEWIQPMLNELPKGGVMGLYDENAPILDELFTRVRAEGGIRPPLLHAYAEVVFSFLIQVPDTVVRRHAFHWIDNVMGEDALMMIIPRLELEDDPKVRPDVEQALLELEGVSDPRVARAALTPYFNKPPWPSLKFPLAVVMARLGEDAAVEYLRTRPSEAAPSEDVERAVKLALAQTPYPKIVPPLESETQLAARHRAERAAQARAAIEKRERMNLLLPAPVPAAASTEAAPVESEAGATRPVEAEEPPTYFEVVGDAISVYADSSSGSAVVGKLMKGSIVRVTRAERLDGHRWFLVELKGGQTGWVAGDLNLQLREAVPAK